MKTCAACHANLPKDNYSKKQWKLDQRRCKVCITNNREVQQQPIQDNNDQNTNEIVKALDSMYLENVDKKISDEDLFKQPPPLEDCPICFIRLPTLRTGYRYMSCCGKEVCSGCFYAPVYDNQGNKVDNDKQNECPFCRTLAPKSDEEAVKRLKKRVEAGDAMAMHNLGNYYSDGEYGLPQNHTKALELYHRAVELGYFNAYCSIGHAYQYGQGVEVDEKKANHYYKLAAIRGDVNSRNSLGNDEVRAGNLNRTVKHRMIAAACGHDGALEQIKLMYSNGDATKEDYTKALQSYQEYLSEIQSKQRDEAAAAHEKYRYY